MAEDSWSTNNYTTTAWQTSTDINNDRGWNDTDTTSYKIPPPKPPKPKAAPSKPSSSSSTTTSVSSNKTKSKQAQQSQQSSTQPGQQQGKRDGFGLFIEETNFPSWDD